MSSFLIKWAAGTRALILKFLTHILAKPTTDPRGEEAEDKRRKRGDKELFFLAHRLPILLQRHIPRGAEEGNERQSVSLQCPPHPRQRPTNLYSRTHTQSQGPRRAISLSPSSPSPNLDRLVKGRESVMRVD